MKDADEQRSYSRGYNAGKRAALRDTATSLRERDREIAELRWQLETNHKWPSGSDAEILRCAAIGLFKAVTDNRVHLWEKATHSIVDLIASQYSPTAFPSPQESAQSIKDE